MLGEVQLGMFFVWTFVHSYRHALLHTDLTYVDGDTLLAQPQSTGHEAQGTW